MNKRLLEEIIKHILSSFLVIPSNFIDVENSKALMSSEYLLKNKLSFQLEDGKTVSNEVWGCQISSEENEVKILLADCSDDYNEYALLVRIKDSPAYAAYIVLDDNIDSEALIAFTIDGTSWLECNTYFQAMFLAGMEQMKQGGLSWKKCKYYNDDFKLLISFILFQNEIYGEDFCEE